MIFQSGACWEGDAKLWKIVKYAKNLAKNEEKLCSTCLLNPIFWMIPGTRSVTSCAIHTYLLHHFSIFGVFFGKIVDGYKISMWNGSSKSTFSLNTLLFTHSNICSTALRKKVKAICTYKWKTFKTNSNK